MHQQGLPPLALSPSCTRGFAPIPEELHETEHLGLIGTETDRHLLLVTVSLYDLKLDMNGSMLPRNSAHMHFGLLVRSLLVASNQVPESGV